LALLAMTGEVFGLLTTIHALGHVLRARSSSRSLTTKSGASWTLVSF
jgi:hypothetical protein